jgi:hypothetical protein
MATGPSSPMTSTTTSPPPFRANARRREFPPPPARALIGDATSGEGASLAPVSVRYEAWHPKSALEGTQLLLGLLSAENKASVTEIHRPHRRKLVAKPRIIEPALAGLGEIRLTVGVPASELTVSVAGLVVVEPNELVNAASYLVPLSAVVVAGVL